MPKVARVGDTVVGSCGCNQGAWTGTWVQGSPDVDSNNPHQIRIGDMGVTTCACGVMYAVSGSPDVDSDGIKEHRVSDDVVAPCGSGVAITGSPDVDNNG
jgi:hypothetical protein